MSCCFPEMPGWADFRRNKSVGDSPFDCLIPWKRDATDRMLNKTAARCANIEFVKTIVFDYIKNQEEKIDDYDKEIRKGGSAYKIALRKRRVQAVYRDVLEMNSIYCYLEKVEGILKRNLAMHATMSAIHNIEGDGLFAISQKLFDEGMASLEKLAEFAEIKEKQWNESFEKLGDRFNDKEPFDDADFLSTVPMTRDPTPPPRAESEIPTTRTV